MFRIARRFLVALFCVAASVVTVGAAQAPAATITMSIGPSAMLIDRVLIQVPVTVTCSPAEVGFSGFEVTVTQASGNSVATAGGSNFGGPGPLVCDGNAHIYQLSVLALSTSAAFHNGRAIASGFASFNTASFESAFTTVPSQEIRLRH